MYKKYNEGGFSNVIGTDGLFTFSKFWKFEYELFFNSNKESIADWIDSNDKFSNYTVNLDGESFNGSALYSTLRRDTENWSTRIRYYDISPEFRSDLGFVVENNLLYPEGCAIKYIVRHRDKGKKQDLLKAIHFIEMIIERDYNDIT